MARTHPLRIPILLSRVDELGMQRVVYSELIVRSSTEPPNLELAIAGMTIKLGLSPGAGSELVEELQRLMMVEELRGL